VNRITPELIETHLGKQKRIKRLWWGGWLVDLESGASVTITRNRIDFGKYRELENRADVEEWMFQNEVEACLELGQEIWGGIRVFGGPTKSDEAAVLEYAASTGINTGDQGLVFRHFGAEATTKYTLNGFRVSQPNGAYVKFECGAIEKVCGDNMLRPALSMVHEIAPDRVVVRGKAELLLMALHEARSMDIAIIPECDMEMFIVVASNVAVVLCAVLAFQWLNIWQALVVGYISGCSICMVASRIFCKQFQAMARRKGLEIVKFDTAKAVRKATIEDARKRGML